MDSTDGKTCFVQGRSQFIRGERSLTMQLYSGNGAHRTSLPNRDRQDIGDWLPSDHLLDTTAGSTEPMYAQSSWWQRLAGRQNIKQEMAVGREIGRHSSKCSNQVTDRQEVIERIEIRCNQVDRTGKVKFSDVLQ